eukprot:124780_1
MKSNCSTIGCAEATSNIKKVYLTVITPNVCLSCSKTNATNRCSGCRMVYYCNTKCQRNNWKDHKTYCKQNTGSKLQWRHGFYGYKLDTDFINSLLPQDQSLILPRKIKNEWYRLFCRKCNSKDLQTCTFKNCTNKHMHTGSCLSVCQNHRICGTCDEYIALGEYRELCLQCNSEYHTLKRYPNICGMGSICNYCRDKSNTNKIIKFIKTRLVSSDEEYHKFIKAKRNKLYGTTYAIIKRKFCPEICDIILSLLVNITTNMVIRLTCCGILDEKEHALKYNYYPSACCMMDLLAITDTKYNLHFLFDNYTLDERAWYYMLNDEVKKLLIEKKKIDGLILPVCIIDNNYYRIFCGVGGGGTKCEVKGCNNMENYSNKYCWNHLQCCQCKKNVLYSTEMCPDCRNVYCNNCLTSTKHGMKCN